MKLFSLIKKMIRIERAKNWAGGISICILTSALIFMTFPAWSADYYFAQSAAGGNDAASCANAKAISYLTGSWSGKVSAGDTVHLCGTFTGAANSTMLTVGASGTSGSPITVKFETGAKLTSQQWSQSGAIAATSKNYIVIDGGTNGIIENTANGVGFSVHS